MVSGEHRNGIRVTWVISSRNTTTGICRWISLFAIRIKERLDCHVQDFITANAATGIGALR